MNLTHSAGTDVHHGRTTKDEAIVSAIRAQSEPFKGMITGPAARAPYDEMIGQIPGAAGVEYEEAVVGGVRGFWCRPENARPDAVILYLHGGAYVLGSASAYRHFVGQIAAATKTPAFVADYGLAPERAFPAAVEDAQAAYRGLVGQGAGKIVIIGDSAGGGLSLVLLSLAQAAAVAGNGLAPSACIVMSPWTDLALTGASIETKAAEDPFITREMLAICAGLYLGAQPSDNPLASPLYGDLKGLPPIQLHVGTSEALLDDSLRYAEQARAAGVEATAHVWEGMPHVFTSSIGTLDAADQALSLMAAFVVDKLQ